MLSIQAAGVGRAEYYLRELDDAAAAAAPEADRHLIYLQGAPGPALAAAPADRDGVAPLAPTLAPTLAAPSPANAARPSAGCWWGRGAAALGLAGSAVERDAFVSLFLGTSPGDGRPLVQNAGSDGRRCAWDLTFSAPKSFSFLTALLDPAAAAALWTYHRRAVALALEHLEEHYAWSRRGKGGARLERAGLAVALWDHEVSREQDPQFHTHCVLINVGWRPDGTTGALQSKLFYDRKLALGAVYRNELRRLLEQELGLTTRTVAPGRTRAAAAPDAVAGEPPEMFEIAGIPETVLAAFSRRRAQIEAALRAGNRAGTAVESEKAALATRRPKQGPQSAEALRAGWVERARALAFGPEEAHALLRAPAPTALPQPGGALPIAAADAPADPVSPARHAAAVAAEAARALAKALAGARRRGMDVSGGAPGGATAGPRQPPPAPVGVVAGADGPPLGIAGADVEPPGPAGPPANDPGYWDFRGWEEGAEGPEPVPTTSDPESAGAPPPAPAAAPFEDLAEIEITPELAAELMAEHEQFLAEWEARRAGERAQRAADEAKEARIAAFEEIVDRAREDVLTLRSGDGHRVDLRHVLDALARENRRGAVAAAVGWASAAVRCGTAPDGGEDAPPDLRGAMRDGRLSEGAQRLARALTRRGGDLAYLCTHAYADERWGSRGLRGDADPEASRALAVARDAWGRQGYRVLNAGLAPARPDLGDGAAYTTVWRLLAEWEAGRGGAAHGTGAAGAAARRHSHEIVRAARGFSPGVRADLGADAVLVVEDVHRLPAEVLARLIGGAQEAGAKLVLAGRWPARGLAGRLTQTGALPVLQPSGPALERGPVPGKAPERGAPAPVPVATPATHESAGQQPQQQPQHQPQPKPRRGVTAQTEEVPDQATALRAALRAWRVRGGERDPREHLMVTRTRAEAAELNAGAQERRSGAGRLRERAVRLPSGESVHAGDRVVFRAGNRGWGIRRGDLGTVRRIEGKRLTAALDRGREVTVDLRSFGPHLGLAYALTADETRGAFGRGGEGAGGAFGLLRRGMSVPANLYAVTDEASPAWGRRAFFFAATSPSADLTAAPAAAANVGSTSPTAAAVAAASAVAAAALRSALRAALGPATGEGGDEDAGAAPAPPARQPAAQGREAEPPAPVLTPYIG